MPTSPPARLLLPAVAAALLLAGCSITADFTAGPAVDPTAPAPPPAAPVGDPLPPEPVVTSPIAASWEPGGAPVDLGGGHTVTRCQGEVLALCVWHGDTELGLLEALHYPAPAELRDVSGEQLDEALRAFAAARTEDIAADRALGCGADHEVLPDAPATVMVAGEQGLRYGFATVTGGQVIEHVVTWATVRDGELHLLVASAATRDGCMADELLSFAPDLLVPLLPTLDRVAAGTALPA